MSTLLNIPRVSPRERWNLLTGQRVLLLTLTAAICVNVCIGVRLSAKPMPLAPLLPNLKQRSADDEPPGRAAGQAVAAAQVALASTEQFDHLAADWHQRAKDLLSSEAGRRIAADEDRVVAFVARFERLQRDRKVAERITQAVQELLDDLAAAGQRGADPPIGPALTERLGKVQTFADALVQSWRAAHEDLDRWTRDGSPVAQHDLRDAIVQLRARAAEGSPTAADRVRDALRQKEDELHTRLQQLKQECESPLVLSVLQPFVTPGYRRDGQLRSDRRPYSLSYLQRTGALDPTRDGYDRLVRAAVHSDVRPNRWNELLQDDRVQPERWDNHQVRLVRDAQAYLRKYGEALVSVGRLEP